MPSSERMRVSVQLIVNVFGAQTMPELTSKIYLIRNKRGASNLLIPFHNNWEKNLFPRKERGGLFHICSRNVFLRTFKAQIGQRCFENDQCTFAQIISRYKLFLIGFELFASARVCHFKQNTQDFRLAL